MKKYLIFLFFSPLVALGANVTYDNPTYGDMPVGQPQSASVVSSDLIGWRINHQEGDSRFCVANGYTLVSSVRVQNSLPNFIAYWHTNNARWQDRSNVNDQVFTQIICDDGIGGGGTTTVTILLNESSCVLYDGSCVYDMENISVFMIFMFFLFGFSWFLLRWGTWAGKTLINIVGKF